MASQGSVRQARFAWASHGLSRRGGAWHGMAGEAWRVKLGQVRYRLGKAGAEGSGPLRLGRVRWARHGLARQERRGEATRGKLWQGAAWCGRLGLLRSGEVRCVKSWIGMAG